MNHSILIAVLKSHQHEFNRVVDFNEKKDRLVALDISKRNKILTKEIFNDTNLFSGYIDKLIADQKATYLIGGYNEERDMYKRSELFNKNLVTFETSNDEPRSLHLGTDIWGLAGTKVYAPLGGMVHSFAFNNNHGDYGATIILQHQLDTRNFYTLYGHLSVNDIGNLREGLFISRGENFAHFGSPAENGDWPPHLHFQVIIDMSNYKGDFPGVCRVSEAEQWLNNSPDPDLVLKMDQFLVQR
ncbi:MAG: peptidoglycan DD-metalloendopeptidase family protein [Ferruginibacter sp.]